MERMEYIIITVTSSVPYAGTTSNVGIKLYGTMGNSKVCTPFFLDSLYFLFFLFIAPSIKRL